MTNKLEGVVEAVGTKFNGSLKLNGTWISFKKGFSNPLVQKGDNVAVTLEEWKTNDKSGVNIVGVTVLNSAPKKDEKGTETKPNGEVKGRDFDAEARGKCRHGLTVALAPLVATETLTMEKAKALINEFVEFSMGGK